MKTYKANFPEISLKYKSGTEKKFKLTSSYETFQVAKNLINQDTIELYEEFVCLFLNRANNSIGWIKIGQGGINKTVVDIRLLFGCALKCAATGIILIHNHPSKNLIPSQEDKKLTQKCIDAGKIFDITILDHLIICEDKYYSFADEGQL